MRNRQLPSCLFFLCLHFVLDIPLNFRIINLWEFFQTAFPNPGQFETFLTEPHYAKKKTKLKEKRK